MHYIKKYDYIIVYNPDPLILDWLKPYAGGKSIIETISFFQVQQDKSANKGLKKFRLKRVFL
ncbi:MAG: hypothetical protein GXP56_06045 [Deltaproteobacteria bacterium]|nr:hypothetical protein [Deltaproteobacteria bacterium]